MESLTWRTETRTLNQLVPHEQNPRTLSEKQHKDLKKSLTKFGLAEIPAINTDDRIIAGHQRIKILHELHGGHHVIEVRVPSRKLTLKEFKEYLIRSNKNSGSWDFDMLANDFEVEDLIDWGFTEDELAGNDFGDIGDPGDGGDGETSDSKTVACPKCGHNFEPKGDK